MTRALLQSGHRVDDLVHFAPRERPKGLGPDIASRGEAKHTCRNGLVVRSLADRHDIEVPQRPVNVLDGHTRLSCHLLESFVSLCGLLRGADALVGEIRQHDEVWHATLLLCPTTIPRGRLSYHKRSAARDRGEAYVEPSGTRAQPDGVASTFLHGY